MGEAKRRHLFLEVARSNAKTLEEFQAISRKRYEPKNPKVVVADSNNAKEAFTKKGAEGNKLDKGQKNGSCNRTACQKPGATWFNTGTRAYYCRECAERINDSCIRSDSRFMYRQNPHAELLCFDESGDTGEDKFICVRVCSNGEAKYTVRDKEGMEGWIEYNLDARWGQSLFVNGEYKGGGEGYLSDVQQSKLQEHLTLMLKEDNKKPIEHMREQPEYFGGQNLGTRMRYNDERYYPDLAWLIYKD